MLEEGWKRGVEIKNAADMPLRGRALRILIAKQEEMRRKKAMQRGRAAS